MQASASYGHTHDVLATTWALARFFTIISNLAIAAAMTRIALGGRVSGFVLGGLTLAILLVGFVYLILLRVLHPLVGPALLANHLLHYVSPPAMLLYWLLFVPHGRLGWSAAWWWALFPASYFIYAIVRGEIDGRYPYPFMDVGRIGLLHASLNGLLIAAAFIPCGLLLVWLDRSLLGRRASSR